jgi:PAS domain S-box-containing protein
MNSKPASPSFAAVLRQRAEARLLEQSTKPWPDSTLLNDAASPERLFHELQVHQVELELQNAELLEARERTEILLEKYTDLYDFAPVGYLTLTPDGTIRLVNLTAARLLGHTRAQLTGLRLGWQITADAQPRFGTFLEAVFASEEKQSCELTLGSDGRSQRTVSLEAERSLDRQECRVVMTDITERKHAEEKVRISEIRYRRLFEAAHDGVLLLDPGTRQITDANPFMTKLLGYPREQLVGKELFEIGLLKDETASQEMFRKLKRSHQVRYEDLPLESRDGRHQEVEVVANLYTENGHTVIQCNIRDITTRKKAEELLRRNEALFSALLDQAPVGVYVVDDQFRLQQCNPLARSVFGKIHPLIGRDFSEINHLLWPKKVSDRMIREFRHTLKTGKSYRSPEFTERRLNSNRSESYEWQIQRITLPDGAHGVVAFFNDITERTRAEETKRRVAELAAANREANRDIARRQVVEATLRKSDELQRGMLAESRQLHAQLRLLARQIITAQEDERKKISRDLHDDVLQTLVGINVALATLTKHAPPGRSGLQTKINHTRRLVKKSVEAVHQFARDLRPAVLDDLGLVPALRAYTKILAERKKLKIKLTVTGAVESLSNAKRTVLFRVAQEALTNVVRHAHATTATLDVCDLPGAVRMEISDNGRSFPVEKTLKAKNFKRLGLVGIKERIEMVGGTLSLTSVPGQGTTLRAEIPL